VFGKGTQPDDVVLGRVRSFLVPTRKQNVQGIKGFFHIAIQPYPDFYKLTVDTLVLLPLLYRTEMKSHGYFSPAEKIFEEICRSFNGSLKFR
jgi:hypothetical protein